VAGGVYTIELAHVNVSSCTSNAVFTIYSPDGTVSASCTNIPYMQKAYGSNGWNFVGYITNNPGITQPNIIFYYVSGQIDNSGAPGNRVYIDAFKFNSADPCLGVAGDVTVTGPLANGQDFVNVTGISTGATNVTIYQNGSPIGSTNFAAGFAAGALSVPTSSPLSKDNQITATQTKNGCTSSLPGSGPLVGGGATPKIKVALGLAQNAGFTGPIGATSSGSGTALYWIGATGLVQGSASAPLNARELTPDQCWQTLTFNWATGPGYNWVGGSALTDANPFAALEHLAIGIDDTDSGPYDIYIDEIKNGTTVVEDFEGFANNTADVTFVAPNVPTLPAPGTTFLPSPNSSRISQAHVYSGTNACRIQWQFPDTEPARWARVLASSTTGKKYPQLDTHQPVTMRILVLPVGTATDHKFVGTVNNITNSGPSYRTGTNVIGVSVTGVGPYTYQWTFNNGGLSNPTTDPTYTIGDPSGVSSADDGVYTVAVNDGFCTQTKSYTFASADPIPVVTNQPAHASVNTGGTANFSVGADGILPAGYPLSYQWRTNGIDISGETGSALSVPNAQLGNVAWYDVVVANSFGSVTSAVATLDVIPVGVTNGTGTGLRGNYYTTHFSTNAFSGSNTVSRVDATVDFNYGTGSPDPLISIDFFTARWLGQVQALGTDSYTFSTISDDGVRLWVNGQKLIYNWTAHAPTTNSGTITLTGTQKYDVVLEYFEGAVTAVAKLYWKNASGSVGFEAVPKLQLYPAAANTVVQPVLGYALSNGTNIQFTWGPGQSSIAWATNVFGPYTNIVTGVISPYTFTNAVGPAPQKFFRLQVQ